MKVKLLGVFRTTDGSTLRSVEVREGFTVRHVIEHLMGDDHKLGEVIWDETVDSPLPNALILLDGVEINNLKGLGTPVSDEQELVLLSVVHGG